MKNIEKLILKLDEEQLKEMRKGVSMAKAILPVISSTSRLYGKDVVEEVDRFFQNPATYDLLQAAIVEFIGKINSQENTVTKGIFLSVVGDSVNVACIHISDESIVSISQIELDEKPVDAMTFHELIHFLGINKIQLKQMLLSTETAIKARLEQFKAEKP